MRSSLRTPNFRRVFTIMGEVARSVQARGNTRQLLLEAVFMTCCGVSQCPVACKLPGWSSILNRRHLPCHHAISVPTAL